MEWYFGSGVDDLLVPTGQELADLLVPTGQELADLLVPTGQELADGVSSSPEVGILSKWGTYTPENFVSPNKYFSMDTNTMDEDFEFSGFCSEYVIESSVQDKSHLSGSCTCAGSSEESEQRTEILDERTDYQLDHLERIEQLDDIFLNSLMEDLPISEDLHESQESQCGVLLTNELATSLIIDSQRNCSKKHITGSSKYLQMHVFSPSMGCKRGEVVGSPFIPCNSEHEFLPVKAPLVKPQAPSEQNTANEFLDEESSLEESVLQELKMVMDQLPDKTRICFRDALYRLAENSKQHVPTSRGNYEFPPETPMTSHDINMRPGKNQPMESETNVTDRAIANLLYNKMDMHVRDFPIVATPKSKQEVMRAPMNQHLCDAMLEGDAEVPSMNLGNKIN